MIMKKEFFDVFCAAAKLIIDDLNRLVEHDEQLSNLTTSFIREEKSARLESQSGECLYQSSKLITLADVMGVNHYVSCKDGKVILEFFYV